MITIRKAAKQDIPEVHKLLLEMWRLHLEKEPEFIYGGDWTKAEMPENYMADYFNKDGQKILLVAVDGEKICAVMRAYVKCQELGGWFSSDETLYLDDLVVRSDYRHQGIGELLIRKAEEIARGLNIKLVQMRIYKFNGPMQNLAVKLGWSELYSEYFKTIKESSQND